MDVPALQIQTFKTIPWIKQN